MHVLYLDCISNRACPVSRIFQPSPVLIGDHLYILVKKQVLCVNAKTGKETWAQDGLVTSSPDKGFASFLGMGDKLLLLNDAGELILFKADPAAYGEISRIQACGKNWCHPAYADGKIGRAHV